MTNSEEPKGGTVAATRAADVLLVVAGAPEGRAGVSEIARQLGISKAVVHRILQSLASRHLVKVEPGRSTYSLGPMAIAIGTKALSTDYLHRHSMPVLRRLQAETEETATVSALVGTARIYVDQVVSLKQIRMTVELGRPYPLYAGASSRAILAFAPEDLKEQVLSSEIKSLTSLTLSDPEALRQVLDEVAAEGVAVSMGERQEEAGSVAAPVFRQDGHPVGSISVCGPVNRFTPDLVEELKPKVIEAARQVSKAIQEDMPSKP